MNLGIQFQRIEPTEKQIQTLFQLLNDRSFRISHTGKTSFLDHQKFVKSDPYRAWYLVFCMKRTIGSFYLTRYNSVGFNLSIQNDEIIRSILGYILDNYQPLSTSPSHVPPFFHVNVPTGNDVLSSILQDFGYNEIQKTYRLDRRI